MVEYPIPLETSETRGVVVAVEFPLPLKEGTAVVEYLDPLKEDQVVVVVTVVGDHLEVEEENPIDVWDDPGEDSWVA